MSDGTGQQPPQEREVLEGRVIPSRQQQQQYESRPPQDDHPYPPGAPGGHGAPEPQGAWSPHPDPAPGYPPGGQGQAWAPQPPAQPAGPDVIPGTVVRGDRAPYDRTGQAPAAGAGAPWGTAGHDAANPAVGPAAHRAAIPSPDDPAGPGQDVPGIPGYGYAQQPPVAGQAGQAGQAPFPGQAPAGPGGPGRQGFGGPGHGAPGGPDGRQPHLGQPPGQAGLGAPGVPGGAQQPVNLPGQRGPGSQSPAGFGGPGGVQQPPSGNLPGQAGPGGPGGQDPAGPGGPVRRDGEGAGVSESGLPLRKPAGQQRPGGGRVAGAAAGSAGGPADHRSGGFGDTGGQAPGGNGPAGLGSPSPGRPGEGLPPAAFGTPGRGAAGAGSGVPGGRREDPGTPDWGALADQQAAAGARRRKAVVLTGAIVAVAVIAGAVATAVVMSGKSSDAPLAGPSESTTTSQQPLPPEPSFSSVAPPPPANPLDYLRTAAKDTAPISPEALFPGKQFLMNGKVYVKAAAVQTVKCATGARADLAPALSANGCRRLIRVTYLQGPVAVTVGVAVFDDSAHAVKLQKVAHYLTPLNGGGVADFCHAVNCRMTSNAVGRYAYFAISGLRNGKTIDAKDTVALRAANDASNFAFQEIIQRGRDAAAADRAKNG